ncbi:hypothetical protein [uncultured Campylobacter sp.]|uniref:hypothetical protein n=1 Tax=uncultured Campylobacter sp. TaxID=218934 RepID=UPI00260A2416|nr:hypothetical protein [uncultured Campylobacter sp.]
MKFYKFCISILIFLSQVWADTASIDTNATLRLNAFDASAKQLLLYDKSGEIKLFDAAKFEIKFTQKYSYNEISALAFNEGKIYLAFAGSEIIVLDSELKFLKALKTGRSETASIDAIYAAEGAIYALMNKNELIKFEPAMSEPRKISLGYGRINALGFSAEGLCLAGWSKSVRCFDKDLNLIKEFKQNSIGTALAYCANGETLYLGDIDGNFINLKSGEKKSLGSWIKAIVCVGDTQFIATRDKIYKNTKKDVKEELDLKSEFLAMYADGNSVIVIDRSGKIYKF